MSMDVQTLVAHTLTLNTNTFVYPALQGLSDADLVKRPSEQCNPIGWLLWHQTRVEDVMLSHISGRPQAWVAGQWHDKFGMPAEPHDAGVGHSLEQVMALQPTIAALQGYATAVREKTLAVLPTLTPADLERELPFPTGGTEKVGNFRDCSRATGFIQLAHDAVIQGFVAGLRLGLHATYPAPDARGSALASAPGRHSFASCDSAGCPAPPHSRWRAVACRQETSGPFPR